MEELQTRELTPNDYELLLSLEEKQSHISLPKFLAMAFEKAFPPSQAFFTFPKVYCTFCSGEIVDRQTGLEFKQCAHHVHKACLEDVFRVNNNKCSLCESKILLGYERCLKIEKMKENRVIRKKKTVDQNINMALEMARERVQESQFGVTGSAINFAGGSMA